MENKELELTPEIKKILSKSSGVNTSKTFKYTPESQRQKNESGEYIIPKILWTIFELRLLSGLELANIRDRSCISMLDPNTGKSSLEFREGEYIIRSIKKGIIYWNNLYDQDGDIIPFKSEYRFDNQIIDDAVGKIGSELQQELWTAINYNIRLSEEELLGLK